MGNATKRKLIGAVLILGGVIALGFGFKHRATAQRLEAEGVEAPGQVVEHTEHRGRRGSRTYSIKVEYMPKGATLGNYLTSTFSVPLGVYEETQVQPNVIVRHLPSDPSVVELRGSPDDGFALLICGPIASVIGVGFLIAGFRTDE